jgi:hypothetical protein
MAWVDETSPAHALQFMCIILHLFEWFVLADLLPLASLQP